MTNSGWWSGAHKSSERVSDAPRADSQMTRFTVLWTLTYPGWSVVKGQATR